MPTCTDTPWGVDVWICPICKPLKKPLDCHHLAVWRGQVVQVPCERDNCRRASVRHSDLTSHLKHMKDKHGWKVPEPFDRKDKKG